MGHIALLPADLQKYILDFLPPFQHRLALARTCQVWHRPAIAAAYRTVRFVCHDAACFDRALAMLSPENAGLRHIRHLMLVPSQAECEPGEADPAIKEVLGLFSYLLPAHTFVVSKVSMMNMSLTSVTAKQLVDSCHVLDPDLVTVLHRRQRYLQSLRLDGWRTHRDNCLSENLLQEGSLIDLTHISHLQLFISNKWQADWFHIPELPALTHLEVHVDTPSIIAADGQDTNNPQSHLQLSQLIIEDLFGTDGFHERLQSLGIRGLDLQEAGTVLRPILHSPVLATFTLQQCRNITSLVQCCAEDQLALPSVASFKIASHSAEGPYCLDASPLNALLMWLQGLTHLLLSVTIVTSSQPIIRGLQAKAITQHAETLQYAYLDLARHDPDLFTRRLQSFFESTAMETLTALKDLRTLYLLDDFARSELDGQFAHSVMYPTLRSQRLADVASYAFAGAPHLNIVGVGRRLRVHAQNERRHPHQTQEQGQNRGILQYHLSGHRHLQDNPTNGCQSPKYFMRAERQDLDGRKTVVATEITDLQRLQAVEPTSDILDVVADSNRMLRQGSHQMPL
ncbi:hypothetical protein B0A55_12581 [Friedmanniomyces simplex]|uniref:F-box domain-containing protein n=1 Tax=Friedmanniomyces simplex TaxID=329884 RepID=A0A4U0WDU0_9PEZI|nr:hypothetical protein B0A55_12581 [Friedmanniomyces simplex]